MDLFDLMFIGTQHKHLKNKVRGPAVQLFFPFDHIPRTFQDQIELPPDAVLFIDLLCGAIHRNNEPVEARFNRFPGVLVLQEMAVGAGDGEDLFAVCKLHHLQKPGIDIRFSLKVENQKQQIPMKFFDRFSKKVLL